MRKKRNGISFGIYIKPQAKQSVRGSGGNFYTDPKKRIYCATLAGLISEELPDGFKTIESPVSVECVFAFPHTRKSRKPTSYRPKSPDGDNLTKGAWDALTAAGVLGDDRQIVSWRGVKIYSEEPYIFYSVDCVEDFLPIDGELIQKSEEMLVI